MSSRTAAPATNDLLYLIYVQSGPFISQRYEKKVIKSRNPERDTKNCPNWAFGFYYGFGPKRVTRFSQFDLDNRFYFIDAIVIPTARLAEYCARARNLPKVDDIFRNAIGAKYHAHGRDGRFYIFKEGGDINMSTQAAMMG